MLFPAAFSMLCCEADFAVFVLTGVTLHLCWLVCRPNAYMTADWGKRTPRTFTLDTIPVRDFPLRDLLIPTLGFGVWMLQLVVIIAKDVF
jgi:hypothetical protein